MKRDFETMNAEMTNYQNINESVPVICSDREYEDYSCSLVRPELNEYKQNSIFLKISMNNLVSAIVLIVKSLRRQIN